MQFFYLFQFRRNVPPRVEILRRSDGLRRQNRRAFLQPGDNLIKILRP
jgi:hypothetical protein